MNTQDFQHLCSTLHDKYTEKLLTDSDVDAFADVLTNVLGREDLRAEGTPYSKLSEKISGDYEADINMTPLLARMYELCRMYENFRARPLTELERKEIEQLSEAKKQKKAATFVIYDGIKPIANCWFEDLDDVSGIAEKAANIVDKLPKIDEIRNEDGTYTYNRIVNAFAMTGAGFETLDEESLRFAGKLDNVPLATKKEDGVICLGTAQERNRSRKGAEVKISLSDEYVRMDCYTVYGIEFYRDLVKDPSFKIEGIETLSNDMVEYALSEAGEKAVLWKSLPNPFAIPGSDKLIGTKKPVPVR